MVLLQNLQCLKLKLLLKEIVILREIIDELHTHLCSTFQLIILNI